MAVSSGEKREARVWGNSTKTQATSLNLFDSGNNKNKKSGERTEGKKKEDREEARERVAGYKNSHNLTIVTGNGPNNFQPVARKCPRKRLVMPWPWSFLVTLSTDLWKKRVRLQFSQFPNGHWHPRLYTLCKHLWPFPFLQLQQLFLCSITWKNR